ncbi:MAG: Ig-like domain-containing protein [Polaromonas sp.]
MKAQLRKQVAALFFLLPVATALVALPTTAMAQPAAEMRSLEVSSDDGLRAGSELEFTVEGTPRARVHLRIDGVQRNIVLKETERGVYTGSYTIRRQDRISPANPIQATMRLRNRNIVTSYSFPAGMANPPGVAPVPPLAVLKIERFTVAPIDKIEPGAELRFSMNGMPGGSAEFDIPGVIDHVPMREVRPGVYEGAYTLRRLDNLTPSRPIVATLRVGDRSVKASLAQPLTADAKPPVIRNMSPRDGEAIMDRSTISVSGTFDDAGGVGVDPKSVRILLAGRNVTADSDITAQFFTYRANLQPGRYTVDVSARDLAGNAVRKTWGFDVVVPVGAVPATVPLQVTSHASNAIIDGRTTLVQGRTAPGAVVEIKVSAIAPIAGLFGVTQDVLTQKVQADANGNFSFSFAPQLPLPGTRYEISMVSHKADLTAETKLVLFQKPGQAPR